MSIINAQCESEIISVYLLLMMHAHIFWIPTCIEVIIQICLMLLCIAYTVSDFHNAGEKEAPIRSTLKPND